MSEIVTPRENARPGPRIPAVTSVAPRAAEHSRLLSSNLPLMVAAVVAFAGVLRFQLHERHRHQSSHWVTASLSARMIQGTARAELPLPPALALQSPFELEAPEEARLFQGEAAAQPLAPTHCLEHLCTYVLQIEDGGSAHLLAQVKEPGRYGFKLVQHTELGYIQERVALHVMP